MMYVPTINPNGTLIVEYDTSDGPQLPPPSVTVREPIRRAGRRIRRNDLCPCGSGKKFKKCHYNVMPG